MEQIQDNVVYLDNAVEDCFEPAINHAIFNDLLEFQMKNNPLLAGKTRADIAEGCYMSESTLKNLCNGKNSNPRIGTIKRILRYIGGGSLDRLVGFAPPRDFEKEEAHYDASLVESIQIRLEEKRDRIIELTAQLEASDADRDRLRKLVLEKGEALAAAQAKAEHFQTLAAHKEQSDCEERRDRRRLRIALVVVCVVTIVSLALAMYFLWEAMHPYAGNFRVN